MEAEDLLKFMGPLGCFGCLLSRHRTGCFGGVPEALGRLADLMQAGIAGRPVVGGAAHDVRQFVHPAPHSLGVLGDELQHGLVRFAAGFVCQGCKRHKFLEARDQPGIAVPVEGLKCSCAASC
ncbi:hypothetical protein D9M72_501070 [compost metagenome]